jgi:phosphoinositide-3-kinase regulatory subunit 4
VILQRVLPFVLLCAEDAVPSVRAMTIRTLCGIISYVDKFLPYEADIFVRSILPVLNNLSKDSELCVRTAFAECMGKFAEYSMYFLDVSFTTQCAKVRSSGVSTVSAPTDLAPEELTSTSAPETPTVATESNSPEIESKLASLQTKYTSTLGELRAQFSRWVIGLLQDHSVMEHRAGSGLSSECSVLKRIVLSDLLRLCNFFGPEQSIELLLSQFLTFLNDQDWELRLAFCKTLPTFCAFVGQRITCDYIYPCMDNALVDIEVPVVAEALRAICSLIELDLLTKAVISNLVKSFSCLLIHPSECIRIQCVHMLVAAINAFGVVETQALLRPDLIPFLHTDILSVPVDVELLRLALIAPVSLHEFKAAIDLQRNSINEGSASEVIPSPSASNKETILSSESTQGGTDASISAVADSTAALSFSEETVSSTSEAPPPIPPAAGNSAALRSDVSLSVAMVSNNLSRFLIIFFVFCFLCRLRRSQLCLTISSWLPMRLTPRPCSGAMPVSRTPLTGRPLL